MSVFKRYDSSIKDVDSLLRYALKVGSITHTDISTAIEKNILDKNDIDYFLSEIKNNNIRYVDQNYEKVKKTYSKTKALNENEGSVGIYLKQVGNLRRFSEEEELELWKKLKVLEDEKTALKAESEPDEETNAKKIEEIDEEINNIRNKLVKSNLRLVVSIAKRYYNSGIPFIDIIDEGNIGLIEAIGRYDYTKGFKFSTYGAWWIKQSIIKTIASKRYVIRFPMHTARLIKKYTQVSKMLVQKLNRDPFPDEIAEEMGISPKNIYSLSIFANGTTSIETPFSDKENNFTVDFIEDKRYPLPHKKVFMDSLKDTINEALKELNEKERHVIIARYGLDGNKPLTLEETGKLLSITRERVRQIQEKSLRKIRKLKLSEDLMGFLWE